MHYVKSLRIAFKRRNSLTLYYHYCIFNMSERHQRLIAGNRTGTNRTKLRLAQDLVEVNGLPPRPLIKSGARKTEEVGKKLSDLAPEKINLQMHMSTTRCAGDTPKDGGSRELESCRRQPSYSRDQNQNLAKSQLNTRDDSMPPPLVKNLRLSQQSRHTAFQNTEQPTKQVVTYKDFYQQKQGKENATSQAGIPTTASDTTQLNVNARPFECPTQHDIQLNPDSLQQPKFKNQQNNEMPANKPSDAATAELPQPPHWPINVQQNLNYQAPATPMHNPPLLVQNLQRIQQTLPTTYQLLPTIVQPTMVTAARQQSCYSWHPLTGNAMVGRHTLSLNQSDHASQQTDKQTN